MHSPGDLHQAPKPTWLFSPQPAHLEKAMGQALSLEHVPEGVVPSGQRDTVVPLTDIHERLGMTRYSIHCGQPPR